MLNLDPASLILGGLFSLIGMGAIIYGRRTERIVPIIGGSVLAFFPLFVGNAVLIALIGAATMVGMWLFSE